MKASILERLENEFENYAEKASRDLGIAESTLKGCQKKEMKLRLLHLHFRLERL